MNPYIRVCRALEQAGVRYVIVGAFGIILQAEDPSTVISTADCDLMIPPDPKSVSKAVVTLRKMGFTLEAGGEPVDPDPTLIAGIVRARARIRGVKGTTQIDLALEIAGYDFGTLWRRQRKLKADGIMVRVGPIDALIRSKELAGRPKDKLFLELFRSGHSARKSRSKKRRRPS